MSLPAITTYCTQADIQGRLSAEGVRLRLDDNPTDVTDVLENAAIDVNQGAQLRYGVARLAKSNWVRFKARDLAVFYICLRRNNPVTKSIQLLYEKAIDALEQVRMGQLAIPDIAEGKASAPVLSNQIVRPYPVPHPATVTGTSTGTPQGYTQHVDTGDIMNYSI